MSLNTNKHSFSVVYESLLKLHTDKKHTLVTSSNQEKNICMSWFGSGQTT